jgi:SAM-dependent methyltransferase
VQYLPGHVEPFVDLVIGEYLPDDGGILDLGGGGLRFALPVALKGRPVTVVDVDPTGLDVEMVVQRVNENEGAEIDPDAIVPLLELVEADVLDFLRTNTKEFALITAFRVAHFMSPLQVRELFTLVHRNLRADGTFVFSAMTPHDLLEGGDRLNEVFLNSEPVSAETPLYRRFSVNREAAALRSEQNIGELVHLVDAKFVSDVSRGSGFEVVVSAHRSTRIVAGYVLKRGKSG